MFTTATHDRFSEWMSNLSLLCLATMVIPQLLSEEKEKVSIEGIIGIILAFATLWLSLRLARISERRK